MDYSDSITYTLNFKKILNFYVFYCAVSNVSYRQISLEKYGWKDTRKLENKMKEISNINKKNWKCCSTAQDVKNYLENNNVGPFCCIFYKSKPTNVESLLYCIRNSLAHGSFRKDKVKGRTVYYLDNYKNNKIRGKFMIYEKTLLEWINLISEGDRK